MDFKSVFKKLLIKRFILGIVLGGIAGFAYYYFVGCTSGSCPITSKPFNTILYGMLVGAVLFYKERKEA